jgi:hypothetical protein
MSQSLTPNQIVAMIERQFALLDSAVSDGELKWAFVLMKNIRDNIKLLEAAGLQAPATVVSQPREPNHEQN